MMRYGGNTSCVAATLNERTLIIDAGSGIVPLGRKLWAEGQRRFDILLSHAHYDHVIGLPFFEPLIKSEAEVTLWFAGSEGAETGEAMFDALVRSPFLPFTRADLTALLRFEQLPKAGQVPFGETLLRTVPVNHPGGNTGFRLDHAGASLVYVSDFEHDDGPGDDALVDFLSNADLALLDCTYTPEDYPNYTGFGHSHWQRCSALAQAARVKRWGAFHHAHTRSDHDLDAMAQAMSRADATAFVAQEGAQFELI